MAVGGIDGSLSIYNKNLMDKNPQYQSDSVINKHLGAIWQVWTPHNGNLNAKPSKYKYIN